MRTASKRSGPRSWPVDRHGRWRRQLRSFAALSTVIALLGAAGSAAADTPQKFWPAAVEAQYTLAFNGFKIGHLNARTKVAGNTYDLSGSGEVKMLWGAVTWTGSSAAKGIFSKGAAPHPSVFEFKWSNKRKEGATRVAFKNRVATDISVVPPPDPHTDIVPLAPSHKEGIDPVSAVLVLSKADGRPPCDRTVGIFDGKQRYDLVMTPKRMTQLPSTPKGAPPEIAHVCRVMYVPIAGHRDNEATKTYRSNRDVEVVMRRVPGSEMFMTHSVTVPSFWGTATMTAARIEVTTAAGTKVAMVK